MLSEERTALANIKLLEWAIEDTKKLIETCQREMGSFDFENDKDDEHVAATTNDAGKVVPAGDITFGMIRRALIGLAVLEGFLAVEKEKFVAKYGKKFDKGRGDGPQHNSKTE